MTDNKPPLSRKAVGPSMAGTCGETSEEGGRRNQVLGLTALLLLGAPTPGSEHTALTFIPQSCCRHCGATDKAPTMRRCMPSPSLSRRDVTATSKHTKPTAAKTHTPPPANRTTTQESDTPQNLTKGPSAARCRHSAEAMPSWQKYCSRAQKTATARLPRPTWSVGR